MSNCFDSVVNEDFQREFYVTVRSGVCLQHVRKKTNGFACLTCSGSADILKACVVITL